MSGDLHLLTVAEATNLIRSGEINSQELVSACVGQIEKFEPRLKAWAYLNAEKALDQAKAFDEKRPRSGQAPGLLGGVPVGIKDVFNTIDAPTAMGSPLWKDFTPGNDARAVFHLKRADAIMMGKTVTAEFAVHAPGPTLNPHDPTRIPGTSSSGSAVAVASKMVPCALGTQTAGSVIRPASYCGIYGMKPSFGLIPRTGMLKTTDSLDTIGFFSRSAEDLEILLDVLRVHGQDYPISETKLSDRIFQNKKGEKWRVAIVETTVSECAESYAREALRDFAETLSEDKDMQISYFNLPTAFGEAHDVHEIIYDKSLAYYFKNEYKEKTLISREIKAMIEHGNAVTLEEYRKATLRQNQLAHQLEDLLSEFDACFTLSTAGEAPKIGVDEKKDSCLIWTLCGIPAVNLPFLKGPSGLPMGLQAISERYSDLRLLRFVKILGERFAEPFQLSKRGRS